MQYEPGSCACASESAGTTFEQLKMIHQAQPTLALKRAALGADLGGGKGRKGRVYSSSGTHGSPTPCAGQPGRMPSNGKATDTAGHDDIFFMTEELVVRPAKAERELAPREDASSGS